MNPHTPTRPCAGWACHRSAWIQAVGWACQPKRFSLWGHWISTLPQGHMAACNSLLFLQKVKVGRDWGKMWLVGGVQSTACGQDKDYFTKRSSKVLRLKLTSKSPYFSISLGSFPLQINFNCFLSIAPPNFAAWLAALQASFLLSK